MPSSAHKSEGFLQLLCLGIPFGREVYSLTCCWRACKEFRLLNMRHTLLIPICFTAWGEEPSPTKVPPKLTGACRVPLSSWRKDTCNKEVNHMWTWRSYWLNLEKTQTFSCSSPTIPIALKAKMPSEEKRSDHNRNTLQCVYLSTDIIPDEQEPRKDNLTYPRSQHMATNRSRPPGSQTCA